MKTALTTGLLAAGLFLTSGVAASAQTHSHFLCRYFPNLCSPSPGPDPTAVPEIDASSGLLALAAVAAMLALVWEIRRRRRG